MIAQAALKIAREKGLNAVTHGAVSKRCPIITSASTVRHYFATQSDLQNVCLVLDDKLVPAAIELGIVKA